MKGLLGTASLLAAFAVSPVWAQQQGNPAGATPGTETRSGLPAPNQANVADRNFARAAASGGLAEVELGRLANQKGQSPEARQFGQRMVDDHSKANTELKELAAAANIPLPNAPDAEKQAMRERLDKGRETPSTVTISEARSPLIKRQCSCSNMRSDRGRIRN